MFLPPYIEWISNHIENHFCDCKIPIIYELSMVKLWQTVSQFGSIMKNVALMGQTCPFLAVIHSSCGNFKIQGECIKYNMILT